MVAQGQVATARYRQMGGWSSMVVAVLVLASLFNTAVTNAIGGAVQTEPTGMLTLQSELPTPFVQSGIHEGSNRGLSPATACWPTATACARAPLWSSRTRRSG
jgi:hypothetical protein